MGESVSVIIPAFNEEKNVGLVIDGVVDVLKGVISDYEIVVIDDGSRDNTYKIIQEKAMKNKKIKLLHHSKNKGFGITIKDGIAASKKKYITGLPGDNDTSPRIISDFIKDRKDADIIIAYSANPDARLWVRRLFSSSFTHLMNIIFGLHLRYYNSYFICERDLLKKIPLRSKGLAIFAEAKVRLIKGGASFKEIPFEHTGRHFGRSSAVSLNSVWKTFGTILSLIGDIYLWSTS